MPLDEARQTIYKKNPLIQVICQLRFPRILLINEKAPADFQERIRKVYPNYNVSVEQQQQSFFGSGIDTSPKIIQNEQINNYSFSSGDGVWQINLTSTLLSLSTSHYIGWEDFRSNLYEPLNALNDIYCPAFFDRVGIRYINAYRRSTLNIDMNTSWTELISPFALGFLSNKDLAEEVKGYTATSDIKLGNDVMARVITSTGFIGNIIFQQNPELSFIIDSDLYYSSKKSFDELDDSLINLNDHAYRLVRNMITDKLHEVMEPEEIW